jgi:hypothetical protein
MDSYIYKYVEARNLESVTLLCLFLTVSVILTVFIHFSLSAGTTDTTTATKHRPDKVANPGSASKESTENTTNIESHFNIPERGDQTIGEQPENTSCPDAVGSNESHGQVSDVPSKENEPIPTPIPDGRIFTRGEPPYGYLPTCSPKDKPMPFVPLEPD